MTRPLKIQSLLFPILALALTAIALAGITGVIHAQDDEVKVKIEKMDHGWLGITMQDIDAELAEALDLSEGEGILVNSVIDDSPADKAGLVDGDVIVAFAGEEIEDTGDLSRAVRKTRPGDEVEVEVLRDGARRTIAVTVGEREPQVHVWSDRDDGDVLLYSTPGKMKGLKGWHTLMLGEHGYLGVKMQDLNEQLGDYFGVTDGQGVLITEVIEDGPAAEAGLKAGDIIMKLGTERIAETDDIYDYLRDREEGDEVTVTVLRDRRERDIAVTLGEAPDDLLWFDDDHDVMVLPHLNGLRHLRGMRYRIPEVESFRFHDEGEIEELKEELDELRKELKEIRKELKRS